MAESLANAYVSRQQIEREELQSTAYMALVEAARTFDPDRKVNFATFARHRIRGALRDYMRYLLSESWRGQKVRARYFKASATLQNGTAACLAFNAEKPVGSGMESLDAVENWLQRLPKTHALICRLIYFGGKKQDEVARPLGFPNSHLSRIHAEALSVFIENMDARPPPFGGLSVRQEQLRERVRSRR